MVYWRVLTFRFGVKYFFYGLVRHLLTVTFNTEDELSVKQPNLDIDDSSVLINHSHP